MPFASKFYVDHRNAERPLLCREGVPPVERNRHSSGRPVRHGRDLTDHALRLASHKALHVQDGESPVILSDNEAPPVVGESHAARGGQSAHRPQFVLLKGDDGNPFGEGFAVVPQRYKCCLIIEYGYCIRPPRKI